MSEFDIVPENESQEPSYQDLNNKLLSLKLNTRPTVEQVKARKELEGKIDEMISNVEAAGLLDAVNEDVQSFKLRLKLLENMQLKGEFKDEHLLAFLGDIQNASRSAAGFTRTEPDQYKGLTEDVYKQRLLKVRDDALQLSEVPKDIEKQRERIRILLNEIETNNYSLEQFQNAPTVRGIQTLLPKVSPEVAREAQARLKLQETFAVVRLIGGKTEDAVATFRMSSQELGARGYLLEGVDFETLLKKELPGLKIGEALTFIQSAALKKIKLPSGEEYRYRGKTNTSTAEEEFRGLLKTGLMKRYNLTEDEALRSIQLAERVAAVTFETSVWNSELSGPDPLGEAIYLKKSRVENYEKAGDKGPTITADLVDGIGTSFFRWATVSGEGNKRLFHPGEWKEAEETGKLPSLSDSDLKAARKKMLGLSRMEDGIDSMIDFKSVDYTKIKPGSYGGFLAGYLPGIMNSKDLLLKSDWSPDDFSLDKMSDWLGMFNSHADPTRLLRLKSIFVLGAIDEGLKYPDRLGWGQIETFQVGRILTSIVGVDSKGNELSFLNESQKQWVFDNLRVGRRSFVNDVSMGLRGIIKTRR